MSRQITLFVIATQFLTRLPTPRLARFDSSWLSESARYFPLVGVLVGAINVGVWWLARQVLPAGVAVGLMLSVSMLVTGAFHEDGLADTCDGLGAGGPPERVLAIMKDSRIGAFGAIGLFFALALKWTTLVALPAARVPLAVMMSHMLSRWLAIALIWRLPYLRDQDGKSKPLAERLSGAQWLASGLIGAVALAPVVWLDVRRGSLDLRSFLIASAAAVATAVLAARYLRRRLGGYTGDCLGAVQQLAELAFLIGDLALMPARFT